MDLALDRWELQQELLFLPQSSCQTMRVLGNCVLYGVLGCVIPLVNVMIL